MTLTCHGAMYRVALMRRDANIRVTVYAYFIVVVEHATKRMRPFKIATHIMA